MSELEYKPKTQKELLNYFDISWKTFKVWLLPIAKEVGELSGGLYTPKQVKIIMNHLC